MAGVQIGLLQAPGKGVLTRNRTFRSAFKQSAHHRFDVSPRPCCQKDSANEPSTTTRRNILHSTASFGLLAAAVSPLEAAALSVPQCETLSTAINGIQFCDVREGTGKSPAKGSLIRCHYKGRLASNNAVFDSSYERGRPLTFKVGVREVIAGWDVGILGDAEQGIPPMKEGGKRVLVIPPELAYGDRGAGRGVIPPKATLVFDVELLGKR
ncbi:g11433 [Coccomyxa elongata]